jgi:hypothetical protein
LGLGQLPEAQKAAADEQVDPDAALAARDRKQAKALLPRFDEQFRILQNPHLQVLQPQLYFGAPEEARRIIRQLAEPAVKPDVSSARRVAALKDLATMLATPGLEALAPQLRQELVRHMRDGIKRLARPVHHPDTEPADRIEAIKTLASLLGSDVLENMPGSQKREIVRWLRDGLRRLAEPVHHPDTKPADRVEAIKTLASLLGSDILEKMPGDPEAEVARWLRDGLKRLGEPVHHPGTSPADRMAAMETLGGLLGSDALESMPGKPEKDVVRWLRDGLRRLADPAIRPGVPPPIRAQAQQTLRTMLGSPAVKAMPAGTTGEIQRWLQESQARMASEIW